ncbi:uncharacterized protein LOC115483473 [Drosophila hydei]|uniref:Uncharacterized protein LOC115483473 n=1 Tax=Drosophila hydei TaxID=7224 RepID=A0A6J2SUF8_DROHY|nr:uncharacterized protein LOC115483473 [Drosophila hydei]
MIAENIPHGNTIPKPAKRSFTGAVVNLKKLMKTVKRIFETSRPALEEHFSEPILTSAPTEEELQNWLNEQIEAKKEAL